MSAREIVLPRPLSRPGMPRWFAALLGLGATVATLLLAAFVLLAVEMGTCGGDGGSPYAAEGSRAARFCDGLTLLGTIWQLLLLVGLCLVVYGAAAGTRRGSGRPLARFGGAGVALIIGTWVLVPSV